MWVSRLLEDCDIVTYVIVIKQKSEAHDWFRLDQKSSFHFLLHFTFFSPRVRIISRMISFRPMAGDYRFKYANGSDDNERLSGEGRFCSIHTGRTEEDRSAFGLLPWQL